MSDSCEASNLSMLHTVETPQSEFCFHVLATPGNQDIEGEANDRSTLLAGECAPYLAVKSTVDRMIAAILMVFVLPLMLLVGLAILLLDGRPVLFRQRRVGKNGGTFWIWKFRTMCRNAEDATGAVWSSASDPRITALGRWLRCSHLDELPQFFNVLTGDMNLIGPRPERPEFVRELALELPHYRERLNVRPGITGLAQLHLGYDQSLADVRRKVSLDLEYIKTVSFLQDARILLLTLPCVARELLSSRTTDPRALDDAEKAGAASSSHSDVSKGVRQTDEMSPVELEPRVCHLPIISVGSRRTTTGAYCSPDSSSVSGVVRGTETRQQLVRNDRHTALKACGEEKHVC